jgi:hypothetical protein
LFGAPRHVRGLKTDASIKTAPKTKDKDYYHFRPISGQASALETTFKRRDNKENERYWLKPSHVEMKNRWFYV